MNWKCKATLISFLIVCFLTKIQGQTTYFQQRVDYKISVVLDDQLHTMEGTWSMNYINNSPDTLLEIKMHLWPNAYSAPTTALAKQMLKHDDPSVFQAKDEERGYIDKLQFKAEDNNLTFFLDKDNPDMGTIMLSNPILPGDSIRILSPFRVKIPGNFSRLGHVGQSYQITQWYPKPAVYDAEGWHHFPYLNQGEFYSEFGSFDVEITLPENYIVSATGQLLGEANQQFLKDRIKAGMQVWTKAAPPPSSLQTRTWKFIAEDVHDFAWFADKRFIVKSDTIGVDGRADSLPLFIYFLHSNQSNWKGALEYLRDGIRFYSEKLGPYPYPKVSAVDGSIAAGGGMEYPMVTVIGESPSRFVHELTIVHEVGHNWFYGILASNERDYPWMDEGLNSYLEAFYVEQKYPKMDLAGNTLNEQIVEFLGLQKLPWSYSYRFFYLWQARENYDQAISLHSEDYTSINYGAMVYAKSAMTFLYLENWLGADSMQALLKDYYERWKFKHPQPDDFFKVLETKTDSAAWIKEELLGSNKKDDYKLKKIKAEGGNSSLTIKNGGKLKAPFPVKLAYADGSDSTVWLPGFKGKQSFSVKSPGIRYAHIDPQNISMDINPHNNVKASSKSNKPKRPLSVQFLGTIESPKHRHLFFTPVLGWNNYDKTLVGFAFYNSIAPKKGFEFNLMPMLSTGVIDFTGMGMIAYNWYPKKLQRVRVEFNAMRFNYNHWYSDAFSQTRFLAFNKFTPKIEIIFKKKDPTSSFSHKLHFRSINILQDYRGYDAANDVESEAMVYYHTNELEYSLKNDRLRMPYNFKATWQHCTDFAAISTTAGIKINYPNMRKGVYLRFFAGVFLKDESPRLDPVYGPEPPNRNFAASLSPSNINTARRFPSDHTFDQIYLDRSGYGSFSRRQVALTQGGFRSVIPSVTDDWLITFTAASSFIWKIPLRPFIGVGAGRIIDPTDVELFAEMGVSIALIPNILEVHFPLLTTENIKENQEFYGFDSFKERITFTLDITKIKPGEWINALR